MNTLENLYYGNIDPHEHTVSNGTDKGEFLETVVRLETELRATLTAHPATASHTATVTHHVAVSLLISLLLLYFIREIIDFNEHQPRIKRG